MVVVDGVPVDDLVDDLVVDVLVDVDDRGEVFASKQILAKVLPFLGNAYDASDILRLRNLSKISLFRGEVICPKLLAISLSWEVTGSPMAVSS